MILLNHVFHTILHLSSYPSKNFLFISLVVIHDGTNGAQYTCGYDGETGEFSNPLNDSNCDYVKDSIIAMNDGFRGRVGSLHSGSDGTRGYTRYPQEDNDTQIQFCLQGTTASGEFAYMQPCEFCSTSSCSDCNVLHIHPSISLPILSLDNAQWYSSSSNSAPFKTVLDVGGLETLNVFVHEISGGILGYAYFPQSK